eukprot:m.136021 g.136021  ORF g.136021 m.136021 type:complete len:144 (+) comp10357_c0_seq1:37-468(+)
MRGGVGLLFAVAVAAAVVGVVASLGLVGVEGQRAIQHQTCFKVTRDCTAEGLRQEYYSNCIMLNVCHDGLRIDSLRQNDVCLFTLYTFRNANLCEDKNENSPGNNNVISSFNHTVSYSLQDISERRCKKFPGLGYVSFSKPCA